jgi:hypothetical protein
LISVGDAEFRTMLADLAPIDAQQLRRALREWGKPLSPFVEGVCQSTLEELERTLLALATEYDGADAERRRSIRALVITARDHARLAARRVKAAPAKNEMVLWMNTWLDNPGAFPLWVSLRKRTG